MSKRLTIFLEFNRVFASYVWHIREVAASLVLLVLLGGFAFSKVEGIELGDAIYFAFVTALSVGYGDIHPTTSIGKSLSVGIGLVGMLYVGLTVAIANRALADTVKRHVGKKT